MNIFIYEKVSRNIVLGGLLPSTFTPEATFIEVEEATLKGIKWDNIDYEITDSEIPEDVVLGKYRYIDNEIVMNPAYQEVVNEDY